MPAGICSRQWKSSLLKEKPKELAYVVQNSINPRRNPDLRFCTLSEEGMRMSRLAAFFKGADTRLGVFYPDHALIAFLLISALSRNLWAGPDLLISAKIADWRRTESSPGFWTGPGIGWSINTRLTRRRRR